MNWKYYFIILIMNKLGNPDLTGNFTFPKKVN